MNFFIQRQEAVVEKKYIVTLTSEERAELSGLIAAGKGAARKLAHARVLLKADAAEGGPAWGDAEIADAVEVGRSTVERVRRRLVEEGFQAALVPKKPCRPPVPRKIDGRAEAHLVLLACSQAPEGRKDWTMQLLADRMVELGFCASVSDETVRKTLKKTKSSRG